MGDRRYRLLIPVDVGWMRSELLSSGLVSAHGFCSGSPDALDDGPAGYDPVLASLTTSPVQLPSDDDRVRRPIFTLRESAAYLDVPASTLHQWARPSDGPGLVTISPRAGRSATVPFVGFAEAFVLNALRHGGVPMQRIRPAVARLSDEFGLDHALASQRVYTDGAELIFDYAKSSEDGALPTVVRTGQAHLAEVIRGYLKRIDYGGDGWAAQIQLPAYTAADVIVDPEGAHGQPLVSHGGARVEDLVDRFAPATALLTSRRTSPSPRTTSRTSSALPLASPPDHLHRCRESPKSAMFW